MRDSCKHLLQQLYEHEQNIGGPLQVSTYAVGLQVTEKIYNTDIPYLEKIGYIDIKSKTTTSSVIALTKIGIQFVENGFKEPDNVQTTSFHMGNVTNSVIGTQTNVTLHNGYSADDIIKLIENSDSNDEDKEVLKEAVSLLKEAYNDKKVKKGLLSKIKGIGEVFQRNEWLTAQIVAFFFEKFLL